MVRLARHALMLLAALAVVYATLITWRKNERAAGLDFYIYYVNSQLAGRTDIPNIYDRDIQSRIGEEYYERAQRTGSELRKYDAQRRRFVDSVSSPFLYTTLQWVSRDYDRALQQYHLLVLTAFLAGTVLIARRAGLSLTATLFLIAALLLWYRGFEGDLRVGNVNSLQLLLLGAALSVPPVAAGVLLGLLIAFKPNLILVPLLLALSRFVTGDRARLRREILGGAIGGGIAFVAASIHYRSPRIWLQWIDRANEFYHRLPTRMERNVTPALELFHQHGAWVSHAIALVLTIIAAAVIWRGKRSNDLLVAGTAILIYLMSATVVWLHYMVLVLPVAFALMRGRVTAIVSLLSLALIAETLFEMATGIPVYPHDAALITPAFVALFICAVWKLARGEGERGPADEVLAPGIAVR